MLSLLIILLSVGTGLLGFASQLQQTGAVSIAISEQDRRGLVDARQSLLSYSVLYPYLYGPTGAGPAHFPCPDTDGYQQQDVELSTGIRQRRDGPNPPCASLAGSQGLLPRHTVLPGRRYLFHSQSYQRYHYHVEGAVVNNPVNRVVGLYHLRAQAHQAVASIRLSSPDNTRVVARVTLTGQSLIEATVASVGAWIIQRSSQILNRQCVLQADDAVQQASLGQACHLPKTVSSLCDGDEVLALVLDAPVVHSSECLVNDLGSNTIEGAPASRHWFVRNLWYTSVNVSYLDECDKPQPDGLSCVLSFSGDSPKAVSTDGEYIELTWVSPS